MCMAKHDIGNDMAIPVDNLVKHVGRVRHRVTPVPAREHMRHDPDALARVLGLLELLDEEREETRVVWVVGAQSGVVVAAIVQVAVESDDAQAERVDGRVGAVVGGSLLGGGVVDPALVGPEGGDVLVVPRHLLAEGTVVVDGVGGVLVVGVGVVVLSSQQGASFGDMSLGGVWHIHPGLRRMARR